jgi:NADH dehydrogenase/putative oxidoreductase
MITKHVRSIASAHGALVAALETAGPVFVLLMRLDIARIFFVSAVLKLSDWDNAVYLATNEYPVTWLAPEHAAALGVTVELVGSILLALGLGARAAAAALLALAVVIHTSFQALPENLFWIVLLAGILTRGAGAISLDHLMADALGHSAVPGAATVRRIADGITRLLGPIQLAAVRLVLAASLVGLAGAFGPPLADLGVAAGVVALLLAVGLGTRLIGAGLMLASAGVAMMGEGTTIYWPFLLATLVFAGPGAVSLDRLVADALHRLAARRDGGNGPRVVIVGAGFGGLAAARGLAGTDARVTVIDRRNHHLFQPLLYQVATASLSPADIAAPIREVLAGQDNAEVRLGRVVGVDRERRQVRLADGAEVPYDFLVVATGAGHDYFGKDQWAEHAPGLKQVDDATRIRRRILLAFERAEAASDPGERRRLMTFVIIGAGPTGVELAGAIAELARFGLRNDFRAIDPASARIVLVQSGPRILPVFPMSLSESARRTLEGLGVEVRTNARVEQVDSDGVLMGNERIPAATVLWAAGVKASPAAAWLSAEADKAGRVKVGPDLSVRGMPNVYAIGDTALMMGLDGTPVPGLAPAAKQAGSFVARAIADRIAGRPPAGAFRYRHMGSLAAIGRKAAVADFGLVRLGGMLAWWLWGAVHVAFLVGARNRLAVVLDWAWSYVTYRRGIRLITGED